jgi:hypothetical protein
MTSIAESINWSDIGSVFTGFGGLVPDIVTMVINFVPLLIILAIVAFVLKFLHAIVGIIEGAVSIFKL